MNRLRTLSLCTSLAAATLSSQEAWAMVPQANPITVSANASGANPGDQNDDTLGIQNALFLLKLTASNNPGVPLILDFLPGRYLVKYNLGLFQGLFQLKDVDNLTIQGNGAEFHVMDFDVTNTGHPAIWDFRDCENLTVQDFLFTMERQAHTTGTVTGGMQLSPSSTEVLLTMDEALPPDFKIRWAADFLETPTGVRFTGTTFSGGGFEPNKHYKVDLPALGSSASTNVKVTFSNTPFQTMGTQAAALKPGDRVVFTHQKYSSNPLRFVRCSDLVYEDIRIEDSAGMGVIHFDCEDVTARHVEVVENPNSLYSTTADGLNFFRARGDILIEDCTFRRLGDDALNVHAYRYEVLHVDSPSQGPTEVYVGEYEYSYLSDLPPAGEWEFVTGDLDEIGTFVPGSVSAIATLPASLLGSDWVPSATPGGSEKEVWKLTFPAGGAPALQVGDLTIPRGHVPDSVVMRNCTVEESQVRGALISVPNVSIQNCRFERLGGPAVAFQTDTVQFHEGPGVRDSEIVDCWIQDVNFGRVRQMGAITIYSYIVSPAVPLYSKSALHSNITIRDNFLIDVPYDGVFVASADGVKIDGNLFLEVAKTNSLANPPATPWIDFRPSCLPQYYAIAVHNSTQVSADGNFLQLSLHQQGGTYLPVPCGTGTALIVGPGNVLF